MSSYKPRQSKSDITRKTTTAHMCSDTKGSIVTISPATEPNIPITATVTEK